MQGASTVIFIFDGAMGTMLQQAGLNPGICPESWCLHKPEVITNIHRQYVNSGADIIETNTFGANRIKLSHYGLADQVAAICTAAVAAARQAASSHTKIAGSVGPTGRLIEPLGDLSFETAYQVFHEQIQALVAANVDYILLETIIDIQEMRAALLAAKSITTKPIICQLSFEKTGRTVTGTDPKTAAIILDKLGADIIGANCSLGPLQLTQVVADIRAVTNKPISVQPNAGMPILDGATTVYPMQPQEFASYIPGLINAGASYIGGCCGTTPEHIKAMKAELATNNNYTATTKTTLPTKTVILASRSKHIYIGSNYPTRIIGERINPTGRKTMASELQQGNLYTLKQEALGQIKSGADILDVNVGAPDVDQPKLMQQALTELSSLTNLPLAIDTTDPAALEAGLRAFPGRALINSVSAEPERLEKFLPLAKKYGAAILCLPITSQGVPTTAMARVKIIQEIINAATAIGLELDDLMLDALVLTVAADAQAAQETLNTLSLYRQHFGLPSVMGLSNISFGLPRRDLLNSSFCAMALAAGLDAPILNPYDPLMQNIVLASQVLLNHDKNAIQYTTKIKTETTNKNYIADNPVLNGETTTVANKITQISNAIITGDKENISALISEAFSAGYQYNDLMDQGLLVGMNNVGRLFSNGDIFLPQLLLAAETMKQGFQTLRTALPTNKIVSRGTILLATVKGDIHDLGKNIVAALLENNGFTVIDLGKDVAPEAIVESAATNSIDIIGLCALMTTTLPQMDNTIRALRSAGWHKPVIAGGAVLTAEYAHKIDAHYAADAISAVTLCSQLQQQN